MRGHMIHRYLRFTVATAAMALFVAPQFPLAREAQAATQDQSQVDPMQAKAARIKAMNSQMRVTQAQREEAARNLKALRARVQAAKEAMRAKGVEVPEMGIRPVKAVKGNGSALRAGAAPSRSAELPPGVTQILPTDTPDYFTTANWAFTKPLRKFVDSLPGLGSGAANNIGNYVPLGHPDSVTYPGSDYYELSVKEYTHQFHTDLAPTHVRGYVQTNNGSASGATNLNQNTVAPEAQNWLGPVIVATKDRPVRIKLKNEKTAGGSLPIPVDESIMGSGAGALWPDGTTCNPSPTGVNQHGQACALYPQTRSAIHLHGGRTPWISDGTPHQWILPLGDYNDPTNPYKKGVSLFNVPDMPEPGVDETTYYYTNQQTARLMFYHDHAWGITRLNVLMGEAAGYLLTDPTEQALIADGTLPDIGIPLVIQDRSFVEAAVIRDTDPNWNFGSGTPDPVTGIVPPVDGDFWIPHVYMPAQNPYDPTGTNPYGRWVYGPWFFPPTANLIFPPVPNPYHDPNCSDPDPAVYAFCTTPGQPPVIPGTPHPSVGAETFFDTMMVNGNAFPYVNVLPKTYRFRILNATNDRFTNLNIYVADSTQVAYDGRQNTEVKMVPAAAGFWDPALYPDWPVDGREEGVPDPTTLGPNIVMIGTEGGFLAKPALLTGQPMTWVGDPTFFNVGNVDLFNLFVGPAQRADVLIDFCDYAGKTLILYNDAPAATPAFDARFGYTTGQPDLSDSGGYGRVPLGSTTGLKEGPQVGYGPNIRTVMQIRVAAGACSGTRLDFDTLTARWLPAQGRQGVFESGQDNIIVGQADYNGVYTGITFPSVWPAWGLARIQDNALQFKTVAGTIVTFPMEPKAMHDEMGASFDPEYGRMSTNLGMQTPIPLTNNANMTPFFYSDPPTEIMTNVALNASPISPVLGDGTQIWKISHNGVDMHPIHFHIFDVQLINRVGWDGQIRLPAATELGWQDTVRIAPLEDTIVAMRPWAPPLPFGVPNSLRPLNPSIPIGSGYGFTNVDPVTQQPLVPPTTNRIENFAWEYVWHCHILSHEENDMMRPIVLNVSSAIPPAIPAGPVVGAFSAGFPLTWVDPTPVNYTTQSNFGNLANEIGFRIERATGSGAYASVGTARANTTTFKDTTAVSGTTNYKYRVVAFNQAGESVSPFTEVNAATTTQPTSLTTPAVNNVQTGITTSTWTKSNTTTTGPRFTTTASGGAPATYEYQFLIATGTNVSYATSPGSFSVVRAWSASNLWTMPLTQPGLVSPGQGYTIISQARNSTVGTPRTSAGRNYTVIIPSVPTSLTLTPSPASPALVGTGVVFNAVASGGTTNRQYQFSTSTDGGTTWTVRRAWATGTSWTMPATTPIGTYTVKVDVRTNSTTIAMSAQVTYVIRNPVATGVTLQAQRASPSYAPVSFMATGQGPAPLTTATGGGFYYRFLLSIGGGAFNQVQAWGTGRTYTLPAGTANGNYTVRVEVSTVATGPADVAPVDLAYTIVNTPTPATSVAVTANPGSPQFEGTAVTFTATGAGSTIGAGPTPADLYQYRFWLLSNGISWTMVQDYSPVATWTLPANTTPGTYQVLVACRTTSSVAMDVQSPTATFIINPPPPATGVLVGASPLSPQPVGTAVTFTAQGQGSSGYQYRFWLWNGMSWTMVRDYSATPTWVMPGNTPAGTYQVVVAVRTSSFVAVDAQSMPLSYILQ